MIRKIARVIKKAALSSKCRFEEGAVINQNVEFEGKNLLGRNTYFLNSYMGYASYVSDSGFLNNVHIGRFTCIGPNVRTALGRHPSRGMVSVHPSFFSLHPVAGPKYADRQKYEELKESEVKGYAVSVGNDVWIGAGVTLFDGVNVGDGAIIAAGAVVTEDVPAYTIVGGIPAKMIRQRFGPEEIEFLKRFRWWDKGETWIRENASNFETIDGFMKKMK